MSLIACFLATIRRRRQPPVISTTWGPVSEPARQQAITNMRKDPVLMLKVESIVIRECGGDIEKGKAEFRRRYPELFQ